jgi:hypothetical protein
LLTTASLISQARGIYQHAQVYPTRSVQIPVNHKATGFDDFRAANLLDLARPRCRFAGIRLAHVQHGFPDPGGGGLMQFVHPVLNPEPEFVRRLF